MSRRSGRQPVRVLFHIFLWLAFGLIGSLLPCGIRWAVFQLFVAAPTFREMFGYSTVIMMAFGIFLAAIGDLLTDANRPRVTLGWLIIGCFSLATAGPMVGVAATVDAFRDVNNPIPVYGDFWIWGELTATILLTVFGTGIKTSLWLGSKRG